MVRRAEVCSFYVIKRFIQMIIVIAIVATIVFIFVNMLG